MYTIIEHINTIGTNEQGRLDSFDLIKEFLIVSTAEPKLCTDSEKSNMNDSLKYVRHGQVRKPNVIWTQLYGRCPYYDANSNSA